MGDIQPESQPVVITDGGNPPIIAAVKAGSTAAAAADPSAVIAFSPNSPLPAGTNTIGIVNQGTPNTAANSWPEVLSDPIFGFTSHVSTFGDQRVTEVQQLAGTIFEITPLEASMWSSTLANGGTANVSGGELTLATNTTANGSSIVNSLKVAEYQGSAMNWYVAGVRLGDTGTANNVRRWGFFDANNGAFFQLNGTTFAIVTRKAGTDTVVTVFNGASPVVDTNYHSYEIYYSQSKFFFLQDKILIHTVTSTTTTIVASTSLPVRFENTNSASSTSSVNLITRAGIVSRLGVTLSEAARVPVILHAEGIASVSTEALVSFTVNKNGVETTGQTQYTVTAGKTYRIQFFMVTTSNASAGDYFVRIRAAATVSTSSPIYFNARAHLPGGAGSLAPPLLPPSSIGDGLEVQSGTQVGITQGGATGVTLDYLIIGYEY